jgi:ABC-type maltose transport system permease subunit
MSAAVIIVLPVLVLFFVAQRWVVSGISDGSVKG